VILIHTFFSFISGVTTEGQCGRHCAGGPADTIGVFEFDTVTETVIGNHQFVGSSGVDTPFTSPDGEYIIFFGLNGGKQIDILKPGENGAKSVSYISCVLIMEKLYLGISTSHQ